MILSSLVRVGGRVQKRRMVSDGAGNDSIDVVVVVPSVESGVVVVRVGVGVIGLQGAALPSMALVLSVSGTGFAFSGRSFACWAREWSFFLGLFLLSMSHRRG